MESGRKKPEPVAKVLFKKNRIGMEQRSANLGSFIWGIISIGSYSQ
jgi:hypothetical protein